MLIELCEKQTKQLSEINCRKEKQDFAKLVQDLEKAEVEQQLLNEQEINRRATVLNERVNFNFFRKIRSAFVKCIS